MLGKTSIMKSTALVIAIAGACAMSGAAVAGGYGTAGVRDASVSQSATAEATIWCPRLEADIPLRLQEQMDCGQSVAGVAPTEPRGFFSSFRHVPRNNRPIDRDVTENVPNPREPSTPQDPGTAFVGKWDRLDELNVTPGNYQDQSPEFRGSVNDYISENGRDADWSGFQGN